MPEAVALELLVAEFGDDVVPGGCVAERGRGDPAASWTGEKAGVRVATGQVDVGRRGRGWRLPVWISVRRRLPWGQPGDAE